MKRPRSYLAVWALVTMWLAIVAAACTLVIGIVLIIPSAAWPYIGWTAAALGFTAYLAFFIWLNQGVRK